MDARSGGSSTHYSPTTAVRDAIKAGWKVPDDLKEPDFDPLRVGNDFKKLLAELH